MVVSVCLPCTSGARTRRKAHPPPPARLARRRHRAAAPRTTPEAACLPAEVLQLLTFSFLQSNSNFAVRLPNASEKDVKGLLFRKQPRTGADFRLSEIGKAFQTL